MAKKKLEDLTEKERHRLGIKIQPNPKFCSCKQPKPRTFVTEMFEPYDICDRCNKEVI